MPVPRHMHLAAWIALATGTVCTICGYRAALQLEQKILVSEFRSASDNRVSAVRREVEANLAALDSLAAYLALSSPTAEQFSQYAARLQRCYPSIQSLEWARNVPDEQRSEFERRLSAERGRTTFISEGNPSRGLRRRSSQDHYAAIEYVYPPDRKDEAFGYDLLATKEGRSAISRSVLTQRPAATSRVALVEKSGNGFGVLFVAPVMRATPSGDPEAARAPAGFALIMVQVHDLLQRGLRHKRPEGIDTYFHDLSATAAKRTLYIHSDNLQRAAAVPIETTTTTLLQTPPHRASFDVGGHTWAMISVPRPQFRNERATFQPWLVLLSGQVLTFGLFFYLWRSANQARVQHQLVCSLDAEVHTRRKVESALAAARDEALAAVRTKNQFLANISHDIRTPMNGVLGLTQLALDSDLSEPQRNVLRQAFASGQDLLQLLNNILDLAKCDAGKITLERIDFSLRELAESTVSLFRAEAEARNVRLCLMWGAEVPAVVKGDPTRLRQVLNNLVSNAVKFTDAGCVELEIRVQDPSLSLLCFLVRDTGIGIAPEVQSRLFQPFTQADGSTTRKYGGSGLGLAICKQLLQVMGSELQLWSSPQAGSTFSFQLVLPAVDAGPLPTELPDAGETDLSRLRGLRVLVAEDNRVNQIVTRRNLERLGCRTQIADNGQQAFDAAMAEPFDLILMDCQMPVMDGYQACARIRTTAGPNQHRPIVALTAHASQGDRDECLRAGMNEYLTKPLQRGELERILCRLFASPQA